MKFSVGLNALWKSHKTCILFNRFNSQKQPLASLFNASWCYMCSVYASNLGVVVRDTAAAGWAAGNL